MKRAAAIYLDFSAANPAKFLFRPVFSIHTTAPVAYPETYCSANIPMCLLISNLDVAAGLYNSKGIACELPNFECTFL
jgi:hypothetical protein